jgi:hypothetical protein
MSTQTDLRIRKKNGEYEVRFLDSGTKQGSWVKVPGNRQFSLETLWDKPNNLISIWIDETRYDWTADLTGRPGINRPDLFFNGLDPGTSGSLCIDEFAFADFRIGSSIDTKAIYIPFIIR